MTRKVKKEGVNKDRKFFCCPSSMGVMTSFGGESSAGFGEGGGRG